MIIFAPELTTTQKVIGHVMEYFPLYIAGIGATVTVGVAAYERYANRRMPALEPNQGVKPSPLERVVE